MLTRCQRRVEDIVLPRAATSVLRLIDLAELRGRQDN
jgi:hypothetical protein